MENKNKVKGIIREHIDSLKGESLEVLTEEEKEYVDIVISLIPVKNLLAVKFSISAFILLSVLGTLNRLSLISDSLSKVSP